MMNISTDSNKLVLRPSLTLAEVMELLALGESISKELRTKLYMLVVKVQNGIVKPTYQRKEVRKREDRILSSLGMSEAEIERNESVRKQEVEMERKYEKGLLSEQEVIAYEKYLGVAGSEEYVGEAWAPE